MQNAARMHACNMHGMYLDAMSRAHTYDARDRQSHRGQLQHRTHCPRTVQQTAQHSASCSARRGSGPRVPPQQAALPPPRRGCRSRRCRPPEQARTALAHRVRHADGLRSRRTRAAVAAAPPAPTRCVLRPPWSATRLTHPRLAKRRSPRPRLPSTAAAAPILRSAAPFASAGPTEPPVGFSSPRRGLHRPPEVSVPDVAWLHSRRGRQPPGYRREH